MSSSFDTSPMTEHFSSEFSTNYLNKLKSIPANNLCFDCGKRDTSWACSTFGIFLCLVCSGTHRNLGTHISFVRSSNMDRWMKKHLLIMKCGGNAKATEYFKKANLDKKEISTKYSSSQAKRYAKNLAALVDREFGLEEKQKKNDSFSTPKVLSDIKPVEKEEEKLETQSEGGKPEEKEETKSQSSAPAFKPKVIKVTKASRAKLLTRSKLRKPRAGSGRISSKVAAPEKSKLSSNDNSTNKQPFSERIWINCQSLWKSKSYIE
eukprot:maker-scaffold_9-snap-gene-9.4-mRNA-1 protein AED:0.00 eAED:0.00 QI:29/1/1/1/0/0/2/135/263